MSLKQMVRWLRAGLRSLGCDLEKLDVVDGFDVIMCALKSFPPRVCSLQDFYPAMFPQADRATTTTPLEAGLKRRPGKRIFGDNIQSAEQFEMLAKIGLARDFRKKK